MKFLHQNISFELNTGERLGVVGVMDLERQRFKSPIWYI